MKQLGKFYLILSCGVMLAIAPASAQWQPAVSSGAFGHSSTVNNTTITTNSSITDDLQVIGTGNTVLLPNNITVTGLPPGGFGNVINFSQGGNTALINGTLLEGGDGDGIFFNGDGVVKIGTGGGVLGQNPNGVRAIEIDGAGEVDNAGKIFWLGNAGGIGGQGVIIDNGGSYFGDTGSSVTAFRDAIDIFGGANSVVTNKGAITSQIGNGILITGPNGTVNNSGPINAGQFGIQLAGGGNVINSGAINTVSSSIQVNGDGNVTNSGAIISHNGNGILLFGNGNISNSGSIQSFGPGVFIGGNGNISNSGAVTVALGFGLRVVGNGNITNSGAIQSQTQGILVGGNGNITNSGAVVSSNSNGLFIGGNGNIASTGAITSLFDSIIINGNGNVTNSGVVTSRLSRGIVIGGNGNVSNGGAVNAFTPGITITGNGNVTNTGVINSTTLQGILILGNGDVSNTAAINSHDTGILINQSGNVVNSGNINSVFAAGITVGQNGNITNSGNINAPALGIEIIGIGSVHNTGNITSSNGFGIFIVGSPQADSYMSNTGVINAHNQGMIIVGNGTIENWGTVTSNGNAAIELNGVGAVNNWGTVMGSPGNVGVLTQKTASLRNINGAIYGGSFTQGVIMGGNAPSLYNYNASIFAGTGGAIAFQLASTNGMATIGNWSHVQGFMDGTNSSLNNNLKFKFTGVPMAQAQAIDSYIAGHQQAGSFTLKGETYTWQHFTGTSDSFSSYQQQGQTPNQRAIGRNLDGFTWTPSTDMRSVLTSIDENPSVPYALDQLSPQKYQLMSNIQFTGASFTANQMNGHLDNVRGTGLNGGGGTKVDTTQLNVSDGTLDPQLAATHSRLLAYNDFGPINPSSAALLAGVDGGGKEKHVSEMAEKDKFGFFASGSAEFATQDSVDNIPKSNYTTTSALMGVDYRVTDHLVAGLMGGFGETDANLDAQGSKLHTSTSSVGAYATWFQDHFYANGLFNYGFSDYSTTRNIGFDSLSRQAKGNTNGDQFVVNFNGGYDFHCGNWTLGPTVGIQYIDLSIDSFNESGAGAASLNVGKQSPDSLRTSFGGRVAYNWQMEHVTITPSAHAAWQHEILDDSRGITANFNEPGLGSFSVMTSSPERDWAFLGGGVDALLWKKVTVFVDYNAQVGQSDFFAHNVDAGARITW